jgi:hypothetical protein
MRPLRGILDGGCIAIAILIALAGSGFIVQYKQRIGGRLDQARETLGRHQDTADKFHERSIRALIEYHLASDDPTFEAQGRNLQADYESVVYLEEAVRMLDGNPFEQVWAIIAHADVSVLAATFESYEPALGVSWNSAAIALIVSAALWVTFMAVRQILAVTFKRRRRAGA